ncbi:MAG: cytochrome c biogenesis protein CcsA [Desulfovibrio sp.]|uniref:cytochrome c biogenesis protein CcsA n=1 Tax=Desulfovibrio sp. TaxID=885 RepID=UPI001A6FE2CF|nr:cytochrome c biogenesis protein CcsA [Desulfovibrio sp.]MBD5417837.1 cytochrome c biogenesis protein CcsA [Desulfovibrio sp.]
MSFADFLAPEASTAITLAVYALAGAAGLVGMLARLPSWRKGACFLAAAAFACQTILLALGAHGAHHGGLTLGAYLQMLAWFVLLCGLGLWARFRQEAPLIFAALLGLILFLMSTPWLEQAVPLPPSLKGPFFAFHIGALFLSLGLLALAFAAGALFLFLERRIKSKQRMQGIWQDMPALAILDKINAVCALTAFPLYTLGIVAGLFWARPVFGSTLSGDPKEVVSLLVWLLLGVLFHNRLANGWKGRKPARLAVFIFLLSLFSLVVVNVFMETHHAFVRG